MHRATPSGDAASQWTDLPVPSSWDVIDTFLARSVEVEEVHDA
jgi:hypothetical protein